MTQDVEKRIIHITQLLLDTENPRHDVITNQTEIIKQLIKTEHILSLAKDIANQGSLSPLEIIGILQTPNSEDYIVIEGNRRVCACLLLNNPELSPTPNLKKQLRLLNEKNTFPTELECIIFDSRESADHWIQLRHEGLQNGIGTKQWDATQIGRYSEKRGRTNANIQAIKLLDFAIKYGIISKDDRSKYSITTLQRYLNNPVVRNIFGLEGKEKLLTKHTVDTFIKLVERFLLDAETGTVNSRSKQAEWIDYANTLQKEVSDPPTSSNELIDLLEPKEASNSEKSKDTGKKKQLSREKQDPSKRKYLVPYDVRFSIKDNTLNRVYLEMRNLEIEGHEFSIAYLFRAFLEASAYLYLKKYKPEETQTDKKLQRKLIAVSEHLKEQGVREQKLRSLNIATSDKNSLISPLMIGSMVHLSIIPNKRELIGIWDRMEEILLIIHDKL
jgi:hypothetical protein